MCSNEYKICLLGNSWVGKSSIVQRFVHNTFNSGSETIGASFMTKTVYIGGISHKLNIWDTAGQERYKALTPMYYRGANICIIVYDITCYKSFNAVQNWIKELRNYSNQDHCIMVIAANKHDLANQHRAVPYDEAKLYANSVGAQLIETSARNSYNITELFINAINTYKKTFSNQSDDTTKSNKSGQVNLSDQNGGKSFKCC